MSGVNADRDQHAAAAVVMMGAPESAVTPVLISPSANKGRENELVSRRQTAELVSDEQQASGPTLSQGGELEFKRR